jgi:hypothetical protein
MRCQTSAVIDGRVFCEYSAVADFALVRRWRDGSHAAAARVAQPVTRNFVFVRSFAQWSQRVAALRIEDAQVGTGDDRPFGFATP